MDELDALRAVPKNRRDQALLETLAHCGLRVSEACSLRLDGIDWSPTAVPSLRFVGKRDKERVVPMNGQVQDALRSWLEQRGAEQGEFVFCNLRTGGRLSRKTVWDAFRRYSRRAGIRHVHPHLLRHTFGTALADRQVPVERIRELMGHASIQTSQVYIAVSAEQKRDAVERLDRRHPLHRWLSRQRNRTWQFWGRPVRALRFNRGQTVGRQQELRRLEANLARGLDTLVVGGVGVGKSHLLALLEGDQLIRLPGLTPPRQIILTLAAELHRRGVRLAARGERATGDRSLPPAGTGEPGLLGTADAPPTRKEESGASASQTSAGGTDPSAAPAVTAAVGPPAALPQLTSQDESSSAAPSTDFAAFARRHARTSLADWTSMVLEAIEPDQWTLVLDDLSDLSTTTARLLDRLATRFTVIAAARQVRPALAAHFGRFDRLDLRPLDTAEACRLIRQAAAGLPVEDLRQLEAHLWQQTAGNPRAILDSLARLRKEPTVTSQAIRGLSHPAGRREIDLTPLVVVPVLVLVAFRFIARGLGDTELYVFAGIGSALAMAVRFFLFRAR
jgi:integrase/recombinase XerD